MAGGVDGRHPRGDVSGGLVVAVLEADVAVRALDLPPPGALRRLQRVLDQLPRRGGRQHQIDVLDLAEGGGQPQDLPLEVRLLQLSEVLLDGAAEADGDGEAAAGLLGGGAQGLWSERPLDGLGDEGRHRAGGGETAEEGGREGGGGAAAEMGISGGF